MQYLKEFLVIWISILLIQNGNCQTYTVSQTDSSCLPDQAFVTMKCTFSIEIQVPPSTPTELHAVIFNANMSTSPALILGRPKVTFGANFNTGSDYKVYPEMNSNYSDSRFTSVKLALEKELNGDLITNSGACADTICNAITIEFDAIVIQSDFALPAPVWLSAVIESAGQTQAFVFAQEFIVTTDETLNSGVNPVISVVDESIYSHYGEILAEFKLDARYYGLSFTASTSSESILICSIKIANAPGHSTLESNKDFLKSISSVTSNAVTLNLGYVASYADLFGLAYTGLQVLVVYKTAPKARVGDYALIDIKADVQYKETFGTNTAINVIHNATIKTLLPETSDSFGPTDFIVNTKLTGTDIDGSVNINENFNITISVEFPDSYIYEALTIRVGDVSLTDVKICSVVPLTTSGYRVPCPKCMQQGVEVVTNDEVTWAWTFNDFRLSSTGWESFNTKDRNVLHVSVIGKLSETATGSYTLPMSLEVGSTVVWEGQQTLSVGYYAEFSTKTEEIPLFVAYFADNAEDAKVEYETPRPIYLDMFTMPGGVHGPAKISLVVPESTIANGPALAKICRVEALFVGQYASCARQHKLNDPSSYMIKYFQSTNNSVVSFTNDMVEIYLDGLCNTVDKDFAQTEQYNLEDSLVRFLIYFTTLPQKSIVNSIEYLGIAVDFDVNNVFVGQLAFEPVARSDLSSVSMYVDGVLSTVSVVSEPGSLPLPSFNAMQTIPAGAMSSISYKFKTKPGSLTSYTLVSNITQPTQGNASICKVYIEKKGNSVQCLQDHFYQRTEEFLNRVKNSDSVDTGLACNTDKAKVSSLDEWDEDSVSVTVLTKPFRNATGDYVLSFDVLDSVSSLSNLESQQQITLTVGSADSSTASPPTGYGVVNSIDPLLVFNDSFVEKDFKLIYPGQTVILRYNLVLEEQTFFAYKMNFAILEGPNDGNGLMEVKNLFIARAGYNYPCIQPRLGSTQISTDLHSASLDASDVDYVPFDRYNMSSKTLTVEAFVRLPVGSTAQDNTVKFKFSPQFDSQSITEFADQFLEDFTFVYDLTNFTSSYNLANILLIFQKYVPIFCFA